MMTFENWLRGTRDLSEATVASYLQSMALFGQWFEQQNGRRFEPDELTLTDGKAWRRDLQRQRYAAATVNTRIAALRAFGEYRAATGSVNAVAELRNIQTQASGPKWLSVQDEHRLRREFEIAVLRSRSGTIQAWRIAVRDRAIFEGLMLNAGLRVSEVCALTIKDVTLRERSGWVLVRAGKGNKERRVPLNRDAREALAVWVDRQATGSLFDMQARAVQRRLAVYAKAAMVECTPHQLRHTFAKRLTETDPPTSLQQIAAILGHTRIDTTMLYVTPGQDDLAQSVERLSC